MANINQLSADPIALSNFPDDEGVELFGARRVRIPLETSKKCDGCGATADGSRSFPICSRCGERAYCNAACQTKDWPKHKIFCGKTDRISLFAFWPMLAVLMEVNRYDDIRPRHPALTHLITNSPNPPSAELGVLDRVYSPLPDECGGGSGRLVFLGDPVPIEFSTGLETKNAWWPTAASDQVRDTMIRRFISEGYVLPSIVATLTALLGEMYTTTYVSEFEAWNFKMRRRKRLHFRNSPIRDFGIAKGRLKIPAFNCFAYYDLNPGGKVTKIQDPEEHYWIYFTTLSGEDFILDCSLYAFGLCSMVNTLSYVKHGLSLGYMYSPGYFSYSNPSKGPQPNLNARIHEEKQRFSVLRDVGLREAIELEFDADYPGRDPEEEKVDSAKALKLLGELMDKVAGKKSSQTEKALLTTWYRHSCETLRANLEAREYLRWTEEHEIAPGDNFMHVVEGADERHTESKEESAAAVEDALPEMKDFFRNWAKGNAAKEEVIARFFQSREKADE